MSFAAGYGSERLIAWLYLPRSARPPYQMVIQMAGAATFYRRSSATEQDIFGWAYADYLIRGGRAVMIPIWKGSYERSDGFHPLQTEWPCYREHVVQWVSELRQSVQYIESRDDLDANRIAYQGISNGVIWAPLYMALEPRIRSGAVRDAGRHPQLQLSDPSTYEPFAFIFTHYLAREMRRGSRDQFNPTMVHRAGGSGGVMAGER